VIATAGSLWLQNKSMHSILFCNYFVCVIVNTDGNFMIAKKDWTMCVSNYFVCVIATQSYLWLQHDCACVVKAAWLFGYLWLQAWIVCDCNYFVCMFATRSYLWLQHDCVCVVKTTWLFMIASLNSVW
jgi:hypothetical protein